MDRQAVRYRASLAADRGDDAIYAETQASAVQTCRVQLEPWEETVGDDGQVKRDHIETVLTVTIGDGDNDITDVKPGGVFSADGFNWSVIRIAMRTGQDNGWARVSVLRSKMVSIGSPGVIMQAAGVSPGGRFAERGK